VPGPQTDRRGAPRRTANGFTLVEVMVTLGVLSVGLALASRLLIESQLGVVRANAELANPMPRYALERLRSDLAQAVAVPVELELPVWRSSPLLLAFPGGRLVAWARSETGDVERILLDDASRPEVRHVTLRDVVEWRWRPATPRLVDVELTYRARDTSRAPLADVVRTWSPPAIDRTVWLRVGLRAEAGRP
jgi:prepilin-type N-terminal cleavage/methylation domain-containing protein